MTEAGSRGPRSIQEVAGVSPSSGESRGASRDPDLLSAIREIEGQEPGDEAAERIFHAYYGPVRRFFGGRGAPPEERRDLTQQTFLRVFQGRGKFECIATFEAWLFQIAANVLRNARRARQTQKRNMPEDSLDEMIESRGFSPPSGEPGSWERPLDALLEAERMGRLAREIRDLPPRMRQCILLRLRQGLGNEEIARRLGISVGAVKAHVHQGKRRLNERLAGELAPVDPGDPEEPPR
ncbi:MAG: RNA polymerase sigma factor [Thermoanaerobaculia bacterium]